MTDLLTKFKITINNWIAIYRNYCVCQIDYHHSVCYHSPEDVNIFRFLSIGRCMEKFYRQHPEVSSYDWYQKSILTFQTGDPNGDRDCIDVMTSILNDLHRLNSI
jgi:hypothetical protein